ncbi:MAG TPA: hypothetical protein VL856_13910 [Acidimicrobiia bacterium]|nr:hypothetical protein [Acidimicrobiia bacterium]
MASADEARDLLFERIAFYADNASVDDVLKLAKAWDLLVSSEPDEDDEDDDDD